MQKSHFGKIAMHASSSICQNNAREKLDDSVENLGFHMSVCVCVCVLSYGMRTTVPTEKHYNLRDAWKTEIRIIIRLIRFLY